MLQWVTVHYKILQKQINLRTSLKVAQIVFFSKEGDKLFEELLRTCEKIVMFGVLKQ